jgi:hypothetical protein
MSSSLAAFAFPLVVGRALEQLLKTSLGKDAAEAIGNPQLATVEGRQLVRKYAGTAAAVAFGAAVTVNQGRALLGPRRADRVQTITYMSELLLATGALFRVASEYMRDRQTLDRHLAGVPLDLR